MAARELASKEDMLRATAKTWRLLPFDPVAVEALARQLGLAPVVAQLLKNRGLADHEAAQRFLKAPLRGLHEPFLLPGVTEAVERILVAKERGERIWVYGDYDVDGLTGTAILWRALRLIGAPSEFYVPHRLDEGYGLNVEALTQLARQGAGLVITVDCGASSVAEAEEAHRLGLDLIITDHHELAERLPEAVAFVHPRVPGRTYPFGELSGSGVAFKLAWALCQRASGSERVLPHLRDFLLEAVSLAALGMVADWVPLQDENRIVVRHGLARLSTTASVGLRALLEASGLGETKALCAADVSFALAPRLNAAGRLGCARLVVELLTTTSRERAVELTRYLEGQNAQRQQIERRIFEEARHAAEALADDNPAALVLASADWHAGVIGIVAGRLAELYSRPVLMIALREELAVGQGSGRSAGGFALHEALRACSEHLLSHGGHAGAAGFKIAPDRVEVFRERFCACAAEHFRDGPAPSCLAIDAELPLSAITLGLVDTVAQLGPYGAGNPQPHFLAGPLQVVGSPRRVGKGERHLQFRVVQLDHSMQAIAFNMADRSDDLMSEGGTCSLVFRPIVNEWRGRRRVELEVADFHPGSRARLA
jgi:single-stranded-DNA-specific exonuclease